MATMSDDGVAGVYRLKVSLRRISPMIWRRLLVPEEMTLFGLHRTIQIAFSWEDYHLHAFKLHGRHYGTTWTGERHRDAAGKEIALVDLQLRVRQRILYEYDFGDLWEHEIRVEARLERESSKVYPICIAGARAGPSPKILEVRGAMRCSFIGSVSATSTGYLAMMKKTSARNPMTMIPCASSNPSASASAR